MNIAGFTRFTLSDFPGIPSAIVFTQGCNFKCAYCHNRQLLSCQQASRISKTTVFSYLRESELFVDGVVISGGEPTLQADLVPFIRRVKRTGRKVKLDTNGSNPDVLQTLIAQQLVDYIAMDIKAPLHKYNTVCQTTVDTAAIATSIRLLRAARVAGEFRTTVANDAYLTADDLRTIGSYAIGRPFFLQPEIPVSTTDYTTTTVDLHTVCDTINFEGGSCAVR